jgi:hypothetical protein
MTESSPDRFADNPIGEIRNPPRLTDAELRQLAVENNVQEAIDAIDAGEVEEAKSILAGLFLYTGRIIER